MEPQTEARDWRREAAGAEERISSERRGDWPVMTLLRDLGRESQALVRAEGQLLRAEMSEKIAQAERGIASMVGGTVVLLTGIILLFSAAALALSLVMDTWLAFLVVGAIAAIIGGVMVSAGKKRVEPQNLKPNRAIDEAKADGRLIKQRLASWGEDS